MKSGVVAFEEWKTEKVEGTYYVEIDETQPCLTTEDAETAYLIGQAPAMFNCLCRFMPNGSVNLCDDILNTLRQHGENELAERLSNAAVVMRSVIEPVFNCTTDDEAANDRK